LPLLITQEVVGPDGSKDFKTKTKWVETENTIFCTCNAEAFTDGDQFLSRLWILNTDSNVTQTQAIQEYYLSQFSGKNLAPINLDSIRIALRLLERPDKIIFPFADKLKNVLSSSTVRARRDVQKLILLIKACAFFHSRRRTWLDHENKKILVADWRDVDLIMKFAGESLSASTQGLGSKDMDNYNILVASHSISGLRSFGIEDACKWIKCSPVVARKTMANLINAGYLENRTRPPSKAEYRLTTYVPESNTVKTEFLVLAEDGLKSQEKDINKWIKDNYKMSEKRYCSKNSTQKTPTVPLDGGSS